MTARELLERTGGLAWLNRRELERWLLWAGLAERDALDLLVLTARGRELAGAVAAQ